MTNQVNQAFMEFYNKNKHLYTDTSPYGIMLTTFQAATQTSESEINSLKQRVEELIKFIGHIEPVVIASWRLQGRTVKSELEDRRVTIEELTASNNQLIDRCKNIVADDALAITFQSMGAYRSAIIKQIGELKAKP